MLIKKVDYIAEFFFYLLVLGATFSNAFVDSAIGFVVFFFLIKRIILRDFKPPKTAINIFIYGLFFIILISLLRSAYFNDSLKGFIRIIKFPMLYFAAVDLFVDKKRLARIFWVFMTVSLITFLNGIFQDIFSFDLFRHKQLISEEALRRLSASFVHPNDFAAYIIFFLPLAFSFLAPVKSGKARAFIILVLVLGLYCLLRTYSRGGWFGFFVGLSVFLFFYKRRLCLLAPVFALVFVLIMPQGYSRVKNIFAVEKNTIWERSQLWKGTIAMIKDHPIAGLGINTYSNYFPKYKPKEYKDLRYAHNSYLQMWSEIGIIGLACYLGLIFTVIFISLRRIKEKLKKGFPGICLLGAVSGYIAFLVQAGLDTNLYSLVLVSYFWAMNAYIFSLNKSLE